MPGQVQSERVRRQNQVLDIVARTDFVGIGDLSRELQVSEVTVRSDLRDLEATGLVRRVWGGVQPGEARRAQGAANGAAAMAAALVRSGDTILIAAGELSAGIAATLVERTELTGVTAITGDVRACEQFAGSLDRFTVRVTGGTLRNSVLVPAGGLESQLQGESVDLAFVHCHRIDEDGLVYLPEGEGEAADLVRGLKLARIVLVTAADVLSATGGRPWLEVGEADAVIAGEVQDKAALDRLRAGGTPFLTAT